MKKFQFSFVRRKTSDQFVFQRKLNIFLLFPDVLVLFSDQHLDVLVFLLIFAVNILRAKKMISTALRIENPGEILVEIRIGGRTESGKG